MAAGSTLHIRQDAPVEAGKYPIRLTLKRAGQADLAAEATIEFALTPQEQKDLRWYLEDYLAQASSVTSEHVEQIESWMKQRGEELYNKVLAAKLNTQAVWLAVREQLANLRIEISTTIAEAASIPWELLRDPQLNSPIAVRVKSFVRVESMPSISFVQPPDASGEAIRILMVICRPGKEQDIAVRCQSHLAGVAIR